MRAAVTYFQDTIVGIHAGRANSNLLNGIKVEYYGSQTPIPHLAVVSASNPRLLVVQPFDA
jgi:ribosome recycling factor